MDAGHAQLRPIAPRLNRGCHKGWGISPSDFHAVRSQLLRKLIYFPCAFRIVAIFSNIESVFSRGSSIHLADTSVVSIEKEKARVFADRRAFPEDRTAAGPVVIRDYPSRKKDPNPAVTPQTVPLTAPDLANREQAVQMSRPTASNGRPHCRVGGRSRAPGSARGLPRYRYRRIMPGFAASRRLAHRPAGRDVLVSPLRPLTARNILVHVRRDGGHDPSAYPTLTSRGVHPSLVEP
jgi:hypothetical protein